ncbi:MAG: ABC transporter permease [Burkholderiales bacterium]|nr:ABC transporter permease [Nitrosomonadaceae bacterium]
MFNFEIVIDSLPELAQAGWVTLQLLGVSLLAGLVVALPLGIARASDRRWLAWPVWCFTYVMRGTPMLVQLFLIYYGLAQFEFVRESMLWPWFSSAWFCALLAFTLNTGAYTAEIIAGAIRATPAGEVEAARSLGMSAWRVMSRIVLPSAMRRALPAYSNEVIMMLHGTSLASTVTIVDLTGAARELNARTYLPFESFLAVALIYLVLTFALVGLFRLAERRWLRHLGPRQTQPAAVGLAPSGAT